MAEIVKSNYVLDLRGVECPLNFVKTKIQLEKMNIGEILEVCLDAGEAIESLPNGVVKEGHKVLLKEEIKNYFGILVRKE